MKNYYASIFPAIEGGYIAKFFDFHEVSTQGESLEEAVAMAEDILSICAEEYTKERRKIPAASSYEDIKKQALQYQKQNKDCLDLTKDILFQLVKMPEMETKPVKVMVSFPKNVLEQIDKKAEQLGMTRSGFLANSALAYND